ncbi:MAG: DUF11 domain-containing protein [Chloroflexaceae bacterium]|nr:DUF11 domain-containing protein [Chloroflexaceae bacterium]
MIQRQSAGNTPVINQTSGNLAVNVSASDTVQAGDFLIYTFTYTNTGGNAVDGAYIRAVWSSFGVNQSCASSPCDVDTIEGPGVTPSIEGSNNIFRVGRLNAGQRGQFTVRLSTNNTIFPQTGAAINRLEASGIAYYDGLDGPSDEDTSSTLVSGPVFVLEKQTITTNPIQPGESAEFEIRVGNATGPLDSPGGTIRADATNATNIIVEDTFPADAEFVETNDVPGVEFIGVDTDLNTVRWRIEGPLEPGQTITLRVFYRKVDVSGSCAILGSGPVSVTSDEIPFADADNRFRISAPGSDGVGIAAPMLIDVQVDSSTILYGNQKSLTFVVRNFFEEDLNSVTLRYTLQDDIRYVPDSASEPPDETPQPDEYGGEVAWVFAIGAGTIDASTNMTFSLDIEADFIPTAGSQGIVSLEVPDNVPSSCIVPIGFRLELIPRLGLAKYSESDNIFFQNLGAYRVDQGETFPYVIEMVNAGTTEATGIQITDILPDTPSVWAGSGVFELVNPTLSINDQNPVTRQPDQIIRDPDTNRPTQLIWEDLTVPPESNIKLFYGLRHEVLEFVVYCNNVQVERPVDARGNEIIAIDPQRSSVCTKTNPDINVYKEWLNPTDQVAPGATVAFSITLINQETSSYRLALADSLDSFGQSPGAFTFSRQLDGYATPATEGETGLIWPIRDVASEGTLTSTIEVTAPVTCASQTYFNSAYFLIETETSITRTVLTVQPDPVATAAVPVVCETPPPEADELNYAKIATPSQIRLDAGQGTEVTFELVVNNSRLDTPVNNVELRDILPEGFTYLRMADDSQITDEPTITASTLDNRTQLSWTLDTLNAQETISVKVVVSSGNTPGQYDNWFVAIPPQDEDIVPICAQQSVDNRSCAVIDTLTYAIAPVTISSEPGLLNFARTARRATIGLGDTVTYDISVGNTNAFDPINDVTIEETLPAGFTYVGLDASSPTQIEPEVQDAGGGKKRLVWTIDTMAAQETVVLSYIARSGNTVGGQESLLKVSSSTAGITPTCLQPTGTVCKAVDENGEQVIYNSVTVNVSALISIAPSFNSEECANPGDGRIYRLIFVNTNDQPYENISVDVVLPMGMRYVRMVSTDQPPPTSVDRSNANGTGDQIIRWEETLQVPARRQGELAAQVALEFEVEIGRVWSDLSTTVEASSPDGVIPPASEDGDPNADRAVVPLCELAGTSIRKEVDKEYAYANDLLTYQIEFYNAEERSLAVNIDDLLPGAFQFISMVDPAMPAPQQDDQQLTWSNLTVESQGTLTLSYLVVAQGEPGSIYQNTATISVADVNVNTDDNTARVYIEGRVEARTSLQPAASGCVDPGTAYTYLLTFTNNNSRVYNEVAVNLRMPFGLKYTGVVSDTPTPNTLQTVGINGTVVSWGNLTLPRGETTLGIDLVASAAWGQQTIEVLSTSPSGTIQPARISGPVIDVCEPTAPAISKVTNRSYVQVGDTLEYQINLFRPENTSQVATTIVDTLPAGFAFAEMLEGPVPTIEGSTLRWPDMTLVDEQLLTLRFNASVLGGAAGQSYDNIVTTEGGSDINTERGIARVTMGPLLNYASAVTPELPCFEPGGVFTYSILLQNPTTLDNQDTRVELLLPFGVSFLSSNPIADQSIPFEITTDRDGRQTVTWDNIAVNGTAPGQQISQVILNTRLRIGQVYQPLVPSLTIISPDGTPALIAGVNPTPGVLMCTPDHVGITIEAAPKLVRVNGELTYHVTLANATKSPVGASVNVILPETFSFLTMLDETQGTIQKTGTTSWDVQIPAGAPDNPGITLLVFRVLVEPGTRNGQYQSTVEVSSGTVPADQIDTFDTTEVSVQANAIGFLPLIRR